MGNPVVVVVCNLITLILSKSVPTLLMVILTPLPELVPKSPPLNFN